LIIGAFATLWTVLVVPLMAQDGVVVPPPAVRRDSVYALRSAQNALTVFHLRVREILNPPLFDGSQKRGAPEAVCERAVGLYCFGPSNGGVPLGSPWYAFPVEFRTSDQVVPGFLHRAVGGQVAYMIGRLDSALRRIPSDRWLAGQKVFQLVEHGELERAHEVAKSCRSDPWWCSALVGLTNYYHRRLQSADSAFVTALSLMDARTRCEWESARDLLYGDPDDLWYGDLSCSARMPVNKVLWWLSDPLHMTPYNERLTEHMFRQVFQRLFVESARELPTYSATSRSRATMNPQRLAGIMYEREVWVQPELATVLRAAGVPAHFMLRARPRAPALIVLQYHQPTYHFIPRLAAVRQPLRAGAHLWNLHDEKAAERFRPSYGVFASLDNQVAFFRRGETAMVVAAADLPASGLLLQETHQLTTSALVLSRHPGDIRIYRDSVPGTSVTFLTRVPAESTLLSLESIVSGVGAARARFATGPPPMPRQRTTVSDILLLNSTDNLPGTLERAAELARPNRTVSLRAPLGVFWEVYGVRGGDSVTFSVAVTETHRPAAVAIARLLGLFRGPATSSSTWTEHYKLAEATSPRSVALDLRALSPGGYELALQVAIPGQGTIRVVRQITVTN
jgi:hypothetical protein